MVLNLIYQLKKGDCDVVFGYRNQKDVPFFRHLLGNWIWDKTFNLITKPKVRIKDLCCGLIALNNKALRTIDFNQIAGGYIIDSAIRFEVIKKRLKYRQFQVNVKYKHKSSLFRGIRVVSGIEVFIIKEGLKYRLGRK